MGSPAVTVFSLSISPEAADCVEDWCSGDFALRHSARSSRMLSVFVAPASDTLPSEIKELDRFLLSCHGLPCSVLMLSHAVKRGY